MRYVLGIDSGGTNFRVKAADLEGNQIGYYVGEPANLHYLEEEELLKRMNWNIDHCLNQFSGKRGDAAYLISGTTGVDSEEDEKRLKSYYEGLEGFSCPMKIMNDAELAHYTVTGGRGILIISGTGSIAFAVDRYGNTRRAGGWPLSIFGDEGSGTWVTKKALRHYGQYLDYGVKKSPLIEKIGSRLDIRTRSDLIKIALKGGKNPAYFPQLASLVNEAASEGDPYAASILKGAAKELAKLIDDVVFALNLEETEPDFSVGVWGSNIVKSPIVFSRFSELIREQYPFARILMPEKEAVDGAVELAVGFLKNLQRV